MWRASRFYLINRKKEGYPHKQRKIPAQLIALSGKVGYAREKRQVNYEPTPLVNKSYVSNTRRQWERVAEYERVVSEYEKAGNLMK